MPRAEHSEERVPPADHRPQQRPRQEPAGAAQHLGPTNPLRLLAIQLLPLLVFIVVDALVNDVRVSIGCAVLVALSQLVVTYAHSRRFEWLVLIDVALITALGGVSIAFGNESFFKVKPAIMEGVAVVFFAVLLIAPPRVLERYVGRLMPGMSIKPEALATMRSLLILICLCTVLHIGAVLYTAFWCSKRVWALTSGPGFYLLILPAGVLFALRARRQARQQAQQPQHPPRTRLRFRK